MEQSCFGESHFPGAELACLRAILPSVRFTFQDLAVYVMFCTILYRFEIKRDLLDRVFFQKFAFVSSYLGKRHTSVCCAIRFGGCRFR